LLPEFHQLIFIRDGDCEFGGGRLARTPHSLNKADVFRKDRRGNIPWSTSDRIGEKSSPEIPFKTHSAFGSGCPSVRGSPKRVGQQHHEIK
jgi:hypothetical protein